MRADATWEPLKLKLEETSFFAGQLAGYTRHPKVFLFHLSAFLTSARSVTLHLQAQFDAAKKKEYTDLRDEMLADASSQYFVDTRNHVAHKGYPVVSVYQQVLRENPESGAIEWWTLAGLGIQDASDIGRFEEMLKHDWDDRSLGGPPVQIEYVWVFGDFPGGEKEVSAACREHANRLWRFVFKFRELWEREHDKDAVLRRIRAAEERFLSGWIARDTE